MAENVKTDQAAGPRERLKAEAIGLAGALGDRALASVRDRVQDAAGRLTDYVDDGAGPGLMAAVTGARDLAEGKSPVRALLGAGMTAAKQQVGNLFGGGGARAATARAATSRSPTSWRRSTSVPRSG